MGTDPEEGLIYYNRVMVGHRRPFNHLSLFCLQHRQWGVSCTQQTLELVEKCKRGSWTNTKRLLKPLRRRFMGGQLRWRSLVFGNLIQAVCWSDRKFQTGDFCLWSCSVTAESDTTMFFCSRGMNMYLEYIPSLSRSRVLSGLFKTWNPDVFYHSLVFCQWRQIPENQVTSLETFQNHPQAAKVDKSSKPTKIESKQVKTGSIMIGKCLTCCE